MIRALVALSTVLALMGAPELMAQSRLVVTGAGDQRGLSTFRVIRKVTTESGTTYQDRTAEGLRIGPDQIAVIRPVFQDNVSPFVGYRVTAVRQTTRLESTEVRQVLAPWSSSTSPQAIFDIQKEATPVTTATLATLFQDVLDRNNESTATHGLYLSGTRDLSIPDQEPLYFDVTLEVDSTARSFVVTATTETRQVAVGGVPTDFQFVVFTSTRRGTATILAQEGLSNRALFQNIGVVADRTFKALIRPEMLRPGSNSIVVEVVDRDVPGVPPSLFPRARSNSVTLNR